VESFALLEPLRSCWRRGLGERGRGEPRLLGVPSGDERNRGKPNEEGVDFGLRLKEILGQT
jgi:hypothetical protein